MLCTLPNNSKEETRNIELEECVKIFENSGYKPNVLTKLKEKAVAKTSSTTNTTDDRNEETLVFPVH